MEALTKTSEFRKGKGNKKIRTGPPVKPQDETTRKVKYLKPREIATNRLLKKLEEKDVTAADRQQYQKILRNAGQLRFMYMPMLAEVISYTLEFGTDDITYESVLPYLDNLIPQDHKGTKRKMTEVELNITRLRLFATFIRYLRYLYVLTEDESMLTEETDIVNTQLIAEDRSDIYDAGYAYNYQKDYDR
jgi:hypothetical protein